MRIRYFAESFFLFITASICTKNMNFLAVEGSNVAEECSGTTTAATTKSSSSSSSSSSSCPEHQPQSSVISVEGVELPGKKTLNDGNEVISLYRNGHGIRFISFFGMNIRIYVASFYSAIPILTVEQIMGKEKKDDAGLRADIGDNDEDDDDYNITNHGPLQFDFTFLRYVGKSRVVSAWTQQIDHSVSCRDYEGYEADRRKFIELLSSQPIENSGTQSVLLIDNETHLIDQGELMGIIKGKNFQRSFLSMWFGSKAVSEELKLNLLGGDVHTSAQVKQITTTTTFLEQ